MNRHHLTSLAVLIAMTMLVAVTSWGSGRPQEPPGRKGPPQEAIDACKDKSDGATVEIATPRGDTIKATCKQINGQLVAVPERGFTGPGSGAPAKGSPPGE